MKTSEFSLRPFDQTPRFSISGFSVWDIAQKTKPRSWKNLEFDQNALRLAYIDKHDLDQSIILFGARSGYII